MDLDFNAQSLEAWSRLKKLSDEEHKIVLANVQTTLFEGMELPSEEFEILKKCCKSELSMEQVLEIIREWIAQISGHEWRGRAKETFT